jgi:hypothetical protein
MRALEVLVAGCIGWLLISEAAPQTKKAPVLRTGNDGARFFVFSSDLLGDLPIDGFLREVRQGGKITSAVLDVCYPIATTRLAPNDRFVAQLTVNADRLTDVAKTQERQVPVSVDLTRKEIAKTVTFTGSISLGSSKTEVRSSDNSDISEEEFQNQVASVDSLPSAPKSVRTVRVHWLTS